MDRTTDLDSALRFVIGRIGKQAMLSGEPLSEEQHMLLNYLPSSTPANWGPEIISPIPRNINYERVCALAKTAYLIDRQANPESLDWEFAFAVLTLNRHPIWGLLHLAGMKNRKPLRDQFLLILTGLLPVMAVILVLWKTPWSLFKSVAIGSGCLAIMVLMYFASRRGEEQQLEEDIERCRFTAHSIGTVAD
jgi:hypothetical protein